MYSTSRLPLLLTILSYLIVTPLLSARTAKIIYFNAPPSSPSELVIYENKELSAPVEAQLLKNNFSQTITLKEGDLTLNFLTEKLTLEEIEILDNAPSVQIPQAWSKILIFAFHDPSNEVCPIKFNAINANSSILGLGDLMFVNLTKYPVAGTLAEKDLKIKALSTKIVKAPASYGEQYYVKLNRWENKKESRLIRQYWRQSSKESLVIMIYNQPNTGRCTYYSAPVRRL